ncbi:MAG: RNA polymerase sigma factor [Flavobacteriales bacterium]|nr:RNA polymerase sigma factor [Flavobacteriales bacterium]
MPIRNQVIGSRLKSKSSDESLMALTQKGDYGAFDELYERYHRPLFYFFCRMLSNDREKCEDFLQDIFMKLIERPEMYDPSRLFRPWIYSVAHNMVKNEYKKLEVRKVMLKGADTSKVAINGKQVDEKTDEEFFREKLFDCLEKFDPDNKAAFLMKYHDGFSIEEIAQTLNIKEGTVKSKLFYTKQELAGLLREFNPKK